MISKTHYTNKDISEGLAQLGIGSSDTVYLTGDFGNLGFHESKTKLGTLQGFHESLASVIGETGTMIVPTHSFSLCNTDIPFDLENTPSQRGAFTDYVRKLPGAVRQFHPFGSLTAWGKQAESVTGNTSRHAYGPNTPYERLLACDAWGLSVAMPPQLTCSIVHHMEMTMAVPYRYTKEFLHPVVRDGKISIEPFYLFVTYLEADLERDRNEKFFQHPLMQEHVRKVQVGMNHLYAYRMRTFEQAVRDSMTKDIYAWLRRPPVQRPYQR
ncbi:aminoglycoside 3-N-acetyltransferase [Prosthecobacter fusiformis]|uniref:Aminoglycoside N(3)-acetyltransferase n=1 Tax=Prosthecobacter fusiformis TaxID=48464 RepID=A0A4R7RW51_9BACT|nr:AAC(3) family N-acetyltransferase [Prosthecobacter fusiformis]TDU69228.1 aminoglycoside 3-N-acetyltransferase [Prosthecobacter fusiformis]